jgi:hypothetical protein
MVITHKMLYSSINNVLFSILILEIQSSPEIIKPEKIVDKDHVDALKDNASVLFFSVVLLIIKGSEHTRIIIIPIPHNKKANWIKGIIECLIDSITIILVSGTIAEERIKKGFRRFPLINIPKGNANINAPTNLSELKEAISGSVNPFFLK